MKNIKHQKNNIIKKTQKHKNIKCKKIKENTKKQNRTQKYKNFKTKP